MRPSGLTRDAIDVALLLREVSAPGHGALTLFVGTVRDTNDGRTVTGIEYSAYEPMATLELQRIAEEATVRHDGVRIVIEHRLGILNVGDASVVVVIAHAHRAAALDAQRYAIEELKRRVPIWKREHYADGTREWVDPTRAHADAGR